MPDVQPMTGQSIDCMAQGSWRTALAVSARSISYACECILNLCRSLTVFHSCSLSLTFIYGTAEFLQGFLLPDHEE